ncbi:hypothetical protein CKAH01_16582 [Colletotrichum kahawae]|uniref:Uncharacterized protein n=1 Tax=Colletotrichum kahawae TaxID=34407 RepID=A0AAD9YDU1_COLKA|nr:hypothetical protein CKAH01_16582 [Colletotrichum kahawae]
MSHFTVDMANPPAVRLQNRRYPWARNGDLLIDPQGEEFQEKQRGQRVFAGLVPAMLAWVPGLPLQPSFRLELPISETIGSENFARESANNRGSSQRVEPSVLPNLDGAKESADEIPSLPEANISQSASTNGQETNEEGNRENPGLRQRRAHPDLSGKPAEPTLWELKAARVEKIKEVLDPLFISAPCILLCTGKRENCKIDPIHVGETDDAVDHWRAIQHAVQERRPWWRRYSGLPRFHFAILQIDGPHPFAPKSLLGELWPVNPQNAAADLEYDLQPGRGGAHFPPRNYDRGYHRMNVLDKKRKKLSQFKMAGIWPKILKHPELAFANDCLIEGSIYSAKYASFNSFNECLKWSLMHSVREIQFAGYWMTEAPTFSNRLSIDFPKNTKIIIFFCLVVFLWGLMHGGDWGTIHSWCLFRGSGRIRIEVSERRVVILYP